MRKRADTLRVCIYCLERKPVSAFNREHVMHQAFGLFNCNLVLDCVCISCNDFFSGDIDLKFGRDSVEGFFRYLSGMKSTAEYKSLGRRSTTRVEFRDGDSVGAAGYLVPSKDGGPDLGVDFAPQFGFSLTEDGPKTWFPRDELPTRERLGEHGFGKGPFVVHTRGMFLEEAQTLLKAKGYPLNHEFRTWYPEDERVATTTIGLIGRPEMRVAAKIAMNYLAHVAGPCIVRAPQFDDLRRFVRHDLGPSRVHVSENNLQPVRIGDGQPVRGHFVAVHTQPNGVILAQVSVLQRLKYIMPLNTIPFALGIPYVASAHFWEIDAKIVKRFTMPPWSPGPNLSPSTRARAA